MKDLTPHILLIKKIVNARMSATEIKSVTQKAQEILSRRHK